MTTAGNVAFEAYKKLVEGATHDGEPIPNWMLLSQTVRDAWEAAAYAVRTRDDAMRDRAEVEERLRNLVGLLAHSDLTDDSTVRVHARAIDLVWVLYPGLAFTDGYRYLDNLIEERRKSE